MQNKERRGLVVCSYFQLAELYQSEAVVPVHKSGCRHEWLQGCRPNVKCDDWSYATKTTVVILFGVNFVN